MSLLSAIIESAPVYRLWQAPYVEQKLAPDREYIPVPPDNGCRCNECPFMKLNTLEKLYLCLRDERPEIVLPDDLRRAAEKPLLRMLELS